MFKALLPADWAEAEARRAARECMACGADISHRHGNAGVCSRTCSSRMRYWRVHRIDNAAPCSECGSERGERTKGMCRNCYQRTRRVGAGNRCRGCGCAIYATSLRCHRCANALRSKGLLPVRVREKSDVCAKDRCHAPFYAMHMCRAHYESWWHLSSWSERVKVRRWDADQQFEDSLREVAVEVGESAPVHLQRRA